MNLAGFVAFVLFIGVCVIHDVMKKPHIERKKRIIKWLDDKAKGDKNEA